MGSAILIVDPSRELREEVRRALAGEALLEAEDGAAALPLLAEPGVELVLADVTAAEGVELPRKLAEGSTRVPLILMATAESLDRARSADAGPFDLLRKPFHPAELLARVRVAREGLRLGKELAEKTAQLESLGTTDPLTGLHNRRYFLEIVEVEFARCIRYHQELGVVLLDVDHFMGVNESLGQAEGDRVLVEVARALVGTVRRVDLCARFGGEEFVVLLPSTDLKGSKNVAEKLRGAVERQVVIGGKGKPVRAVTVSVGLAHVPSTAGASSAEATIARAGQALAQAKSGGRNRVVLAGEGTP